MVASDRVPARPRALGGPAKAPVIAGSGSGGGSKGGSGGYEAADTLAANTNAMFVDVISEGPIGGLVNNGGSIYYNQVVLQNDDSSYNFYGVYWQEETGLPEQSLTYCSPTVQTTTQVGVQVKQNLGPVVRTIVDDNATSCLVIVEVPALYYTDTSSGAIYPYSVAWTVEVAPYNGEYVLADNVYLENQKCTSPYQQMSYVQLPPGGYPWNIRVTRTAADNFTSTNANDTYWVSFTTQVQGTYSYPHTALIATTIDAAQFGGSNLPTRQYLVNGLIISVPSNYDPVARTYAGVWDGTFQQATTSNPAWILYDLLSNDRYGLGEFVNVAAIDKWSLYEIAQYCDQYVPDGFGGQEPRYQINCQITSRVEAYTLLQAICTAFRGMAYWSIGAVFAFADMPTDATKLVSPANVIDGQFQYSGTAMNARHSVAVVSWYDPSDFYVPAKQAYVNDQLVQQYGWRELDIQAFGCTSRGLAYRYGKWAIDTEQTATETVTYEASWDHADVRPGDVIAVADPNKAQARIGGRLIGVNAGRGVVTIDKAFVPTAGDAYAFNVEYPDGTLSGSIPIASFDATGTILTLNAELAQAPQTGAMWIISGTDVNPRQYRVLSVDETADNLFKITALFYDPTKYARVEDDINLPVLQYARPRTTIDAPTNLTLTENLSMVDGSALDTLTVSWTPGADFLSFSFTVSANGPNGSIDYGKVTGNSLDIVNPVLGEYTFSVVGIGGAGQASQPLSNATPFDVQGYAGVASPYVSLLELVNQGTNTTFGGQNPRFDWQNNFPGTTYDVGQESSAGQGQVNPLYRDNIVEILDASTGTILRTDTVVGTTYTYTFEMNTLDNAAYSRGAQREFTISVQIQDNAGRISQAATLTVDNPVPDVIIPTVTGNADSILIQYVAPIDIDFVGAIMWVSPNANFDPLSTTPTYQGTNNIVSVPVALGANGQATYYVRIAGYDQFGTTGLNISPVQQVNVGAPIFDNTAPAVPAGLILTPSVVTLADGTIQTDLTVTWDAVTSSNLAHYEVQIAQKGGNFVTYPTSLTTYLFNGLIANDTYDVQVRSVSMNNYASGYCVAAEVTMPAKATPPGVPTSFNAAAAIQNVYLGWVDPSDLDLEGIEVWMSQTNNLGTAVRVGSSQGVAFTISALTTGTTYYFWIRAFNTSQIFSNFVGDAANDGGGLSATPGQISTADIAEYAIVSTKISDNTITAQQIAPLGITTQVIADAAIDNSKIADAAVNTAQLALSSVTSDIVAAGAITNNALYSGAVTADKIAANTITAAEIAANTITAGQIASQTIVADNIAAGTITTTQIAAQTITGDNIAADTITGTQIAANTITASEIAANTITAQQIAANTITGQQIAANSIGAEYLTVGSRMMQVSGLTFSFDKVNNVLVWTAGTIAYTRDDGVAETDAIAAGQFPLSTAAALYVYFRPAGASYPSSSGLLPAYGPVFDDTSLVLMATYTGNFGVNAVYGATIIDGSQIYTQSITADQIQANTITAQQIAANAITAGQIAAGTITADQIRSGTITGDLLNIDTSLPATITVGTSGVSIGAVQTQAADPASVVNTGSTLIAPGRIQLQGTTTLTSWMYGGDTTSIDGGAVAANTITANKVQIGVRGIATSGLTFTYDDTKNILYWTAGTISYTDENGNAQTIQIVASSAQWTGVTMFVFWVEGSSALSVGTSYANNGSEILIATYTGTVGINATYGATMIDGSQINANSITSNLLSTDELITSSAQIGNAIIDNANLAGNITFDKMGGGTLSVATAIYIGGPNFAINSLAQNMQILDANGVLRCQIGALNGGAGTDYGIALYDHQGNVILATNGGAGASGGIPVSSISGLGSLATASSVSTSQVTGLGSLATANTVDVTDVTNLGPFATATSIASTDVTGLGSFATANTITASEVNGLAAFATVSQITAQNISNLIAEGAIGSTYISNLSASDITVTSLSALSADMGTITAGVLQSADGLFVIDLGNEIITISDNS